MTHDYSQFAESSPSTEGIEGLSKSAMELYEAEQEVARAEMALKTAQKKVQDLSEQVIPELMDNLGVAELKLTNGAKVAVEKVLTVSPLKANREAVMDWLEETGHGSKIKRAVAVSLGKSEEAQQRLAELLGAAGFKDTTTEKWVEPQTLKAHVKGILEAGGEVDMELLGARSFSRAKITGKADESAGSVFEGE